METQTFFFFQVQVWLEYPSLGSHASWVQKPLHNDPRCLQIMYIGSQATGPLHKHPRHPKWPKMAFFLLENLIFFETWVHHLWHRFLDAIICFLAQFLCDWPHPH